MSGAPPLRVALDVTAVAAGNTGVARYARAHLESLKGRADIEVRPFSIGRGGRPLPEGRHLRVPLRMVHASWRLVGLPRAERLTGSVDLVHSIDIVPPATRRPLVVTVHDVLPLVMPSEYAPRQRRMIEIQLEQAAGAALVVTTCQATAAEIVRRTSIRPERLLVAPLGARPPSPQVLPRAIPERYVLAVGSLTPRKGFHHLVEAMRLLGPDAPVLVVVGPEGWRSDVFHRSVAQSGLGDRVRVLGYVDDDELESLYRHADVLCHPSEAEGFGIPVLEAMRYGVPVVAGDIPSVREIVGGTAVLVPPRDPAALAEALSETLSGGSRRDERVRAARERAEPMTWEAMSDLIVDGYRRVVG